MERKYNINNSEIIIRFGDILQTKTEVIVSSDDCFYLWVEVFQNVFLLQQANH